MTARLALTLVSVALLAGCGGGGGTSAGSANGAIPNGGGGVNGVSVGNCLNDENFIVQPSQTTLDGSSPAGVSFTLTFFKDPAAAKKVAAKRNPKTTAVAENGVIDFRGNPSAFAGAPPAKISQAELKVIKSCIVQNK